MKNRLSACAAAAVLLALGAAVSPAREFTDKNGRKIEAEIVAVREGKVQLKKSGDNRLFLVPVDTFSEDDQAFIKKWAVENIEYRFDVRAQEKKLEQDRKDSKSVEKWVYELEITNRTSADLTGITVHYNAFIQVTDERKGSGAYENEEMLVQGGALDIGKMEFNKAIRQTTKPVLLTQSESTGKEQTGVDCEGKPTYSRFKLIHDEGFEGLWLKFYRDGKLIFEHKTRERGVEKWKWQDPDATGGAELKALEPKGQK